MSTQQRIDSFATNPEEIQKTMAFMKVAAAESDSADFKVAAIMTDILLRFHRLEAPTAGPDPIGRN